MSVIASRTVSILPPLDHLPQLLERSSRQEGTCSEPFRANRLYGGARAGSGERNRGELDGAAARASAEGEDRDHRRRRRRRLDRLPPGRARRARRRPARPRRADQRLDLPLRRPRRPAARQRLADEDDDVQRRALPHARVRLGRVRRHPPGLHARARAGGAAPGRLGEDLRAAARAAQPARGAGALPADGHRRRALRLLPRDRRLPRPLAADLRARRRRARGRRRRSSPTRA